MVSFTLWAVHPRGKIKIILAGLFLKVIDFSIGM
jgi:hypothetical protein